MNTFQSKMSALYAKLEDANHSVSLMAHFMDLTPSDRTISDYENALEYAKSVRAEIGAAADQEIAWRDRAAYLKA